MLTFSMGRQDTSSTISAERKDSSRGGSERGEGEGKERVFQGPTTSKGQYHEVGRWEKVIESQLYWLLGNFQGQVGGKENLT